MRAALLLLLLAAPSPALADAAPPGLPPMPRCDAAREGVAACLAGRACLCRHERGGSVAGRAAGFRWDCGPLRPDCPAPAAPPAQPPPPGYGAPPGWPPDPSTLPWGR